MSKFATFTKMALFVAFILASLLGQPLYAQTQNPPPGTGKTLTAALLGKVQPVEANSFSPNAGQTVQILIEAADASTAFSANAKVYGSGMSAGKVSYSDLSVMISLEKVHCTPNGPILLFGGKFHRNTGGMLVALGDGSVRVHSKGGDGNMLVFDIVDPNNSSKTIEAPGKMTFYSKVCD